MHFPVISTTLFRPTNITWDARKNSSSTSRLSPAKKPASKNIHSRFPPTEGFGLYFSQPNSLAQLMSIFYARKVGPVKRWEFHNPVENPSISVFVWANLRISSHVSFSQIQHHPRVKSSQDSLSLCSRHDSLHQEVKPTKWLLPLRTFFLECRADEVDALHCLESDVSGKSLQSCQYLLQSAGHSNTCCEPEFFAGNPHSKTFHPPPKRCFFFFAYGCPGFGDAMHQISCS